MLSMAWIVHILLLWVLSRLLAVELKLDSGAKGGTGGQGYIYSDVWRSSSS